jgi:hypothetical protein
VPNTQCGGGGVKFVSIDRGDYDIARRKTIKTFVLITSKNSASGHEKHNSQMNKEYVKKIRSQANKREQLVTREQEMKRRSATMQQLQDILYIKKIM